MVAESSDLSGTGHYKFGTRQVFRAPPSIAGHWPATDNALFFVLALFVRFVLYFPKQLFVAFVA